MMLKTFMIGFAAGYMTKWTFVLIGVAWKNRHVDRD